MACLHVYMDGPNFELWLNYEDAWGQSGVCLGRGPSEQAALGAALVELTDAVHELERRQQRVSEGSPVEIRR